MNNSVTKTEAAETFYHLVSPNLPPFCQGTACFVARHLNPWRFSQAEAQSSRLKPGELFSTFHSPDLFLNKVTGPHRDSQVKTPEYKLTAVHIEAAGT
ncbi:hypothetical protein [Candidatus Methylomirabilis sp.]|uniref:hypothetical protein n=1 Tax=Candidatus Methylomirabilis sp. TaxID=2032687 RepID=UPI002A60234B|nr:hypothetical protein [Candidatus Methylomirabilis sp.]